MGMLVQLSVMLGAKHAPLPISTSVLSVLVGLPSLVGIVYLVLAHVKHVKNQTHLLAYHVMEMLSYRTNNVLAVIHRLTALPVKKTTLLHALNVPMDLVCKLMIPAKKAVHSIVSLAKTLLSVLFVSRDTQQTLMVNVCYVWPIVEGALALLQDCV